MDKIIVHGGPALEGTVKVSGSKNSALPILAATLLTRDECIIHRVPDLSDVHYMLQILTHLGAEVERASGIVRVKAEKVATVAPYDVVRKMRASICLLGPLLGREREATVSLPGGCVIGDRPIDLHLRGLQALGAAVRVHAGNVKLFAPHLRGARVSMVGRCGTTVLGTDNVMMAAVLTEGETVIEDAAREPEVIDLANFLNKMGAKVHGAGTSTITIEGVNELHGAEHEVIPDRIEAGTFLIAAALAGKQVTVARARADHLTAVTDALQAAGFHIHGRNGSLTIQANGTPKPLHLKTEPYPGFPTDMQAQMCALLSLASGESSVTETIFPQRFMHISELKRMGAAIELEGAAAKIAGVGGLSGAPVMASDLRASAALVLAGLRADGLTEINRVYHIDRGYEQIDEKLSGLGAHIERVKV
ncbi:MAG: UDP-N-acetylglucosamine 1-carboxyvinyltransferase [Verrucomicrobia bacterium]|nr:UDP-N-acetylglucosamine 1-carboxyvinyltransferase [Verrucomicrobiota bacterium]